MFLIDTNVILRYLLNDIPEQADEAEEYIRQGTFTLPEIIAEVVYVLTKLYKVPRNKMGDIISPLFDEVYIENKELMLLALNIYSNSKMLKVYIQNNYISRFI